MFEAFRDLRNRLVHEITARFSHVEDELAERTLRLVGIESASDSSVLRAQLIVSVLYSITAMRTVDISDMLANRPAPARESYASRLRQTILAPIVMAYSGESTPIFQNKIGIAFGRLLALRLTPS